MLKQFSGIEGRISVDQVLDEYFKSQNWNLQYQGVSYVTPQDAAKTLGISYHILMEHLGKTDYDLEKAMELFGKNPTIAVLDGKEYTSKADIAKSLGVDVDKFDAYLVHEGSIEAAYDAIKDEKQHVLYTWNGKDYYTLKDLAKDMGIGYAKLTSYTQLFDGNAEKALMMIKAKESATTICTEDGKELNITDWATILGVKQMTLKSYLDRGMTVAQIKEHISGQDSNTPLRGLKKTQQPDGGKADLLEYCIENKLSFSGIYYMITEYGRSISEAINYYRTNEQEMPREWIDERYDTPLKQMLSDEGINILRIRTIMSRNPMSLREALEYLVVRDDAKEKSLNPEWQHEIYSAYTEPGLSEKEREECVKAFFITPEEIKAIEECKEIVDRLDRQLDLYTIAGCIQDHVFTDIEVDQMIDEYLSGRDHTDQNTYQYQGITYHSIAEAAKALEVNRFSLLKCLRETDNDMERSMDLLASDPRYLSKRVYVYKGKLYRTIRELSKITDISEAILSNILNKHPVKEGRIEVDQLLDEYVRKRDERNKPTYQYAGVFYHSRAEAAKALKVDFNALSHLLSKTGNDLEKAMELYEKRKAIARNADKKHTNKDGIAKAADVGRENLKEHTIQCEHNAQKAQIMTNAKDSTKTISTKDGKELNIPELASLLGVKQMTLKSYLDRGMTIAQIKERASGQNLDTSLRGLKMAQKLGRAKGVLLEYCMENQLNFNVIYHMVTEYGKSISKAINCYCTVGPEIPRKWIHERYDNLLKHMLSDEKIDPQEVINIMGKNQMPLREALEYIVVRDDANEKGIDPEWQHEIYSAYTDPGLSEEERPECVKVFHITPEEIKAIEESKEKVDTLERKLDLYEIAECMRDKVFTDAEMTKVMKSYKISDQELKTIVIDFCVDLKVGAEETDKRLENNTELKSFITDTIDRYEKLSRHVQDDGKEEMESSKSSEENPNI